VRAVRAGRIGAGAALDPAERVNLTIAGGAVATSAAVASPMFTASLALGAVLEMVNYRALRRFTDALLGGDLAGGGPWAGGFGLRFGLLAIAMTVSIAAGAHPVGLILGLSTMVPAVVIAALMHPPPPPPSDLPALPPDDPSWDDWSVWLARERHREDEDEGGAW